MNILEMGICPSATEAQRRTEKVREAIQKLGTKYLCHPANHVQRKPRGK